MLLGDHRDDTGSNRDQGISASDWLRVQRIVGSVAVHGVFIFLSIPMMGSVMESSLHW
jgi:hypothetical protein